MALANKLLTSMPEDPMGRLASEPDEQADELDAVSAASEEPTDELADSMATVSKPAVGQTPPIPQEVGEKKEKDPSCNFPSWTKVIHATWPVTAAAQAPLTLDKLK